MNTKQLLRGCYTVTQLDPRGWVDETLRAEAKAALLKRCEELLTTSRSAEVHEFARSMPARLAAMEERARKELAGE